MKIAVLVYGLDQIGGIKKHALHLGREFKALGHQVDIYCVEYNPDRCYPELIQDFEIKALRKADRPKAGHRQRLYGLRMVNYLWTLWKDYKDQRQLSATILSGYDVINPHGNKIIWAAASYKKVHLSPVVWLCNDFIPRASYNDVTAHSIRLKIELSVKKTLASPFAAYDQKAVRSIDKIAVLSNRVKSQMIEYYEVDPSVLRAGVDVSKFAKGDGPRVRSHYGIQNNAFLLLTVCSLMPHRRLEDVIQAVRILVDNGESVYYLIVGRMSQDPDCTKQLQYEIAASNLENHIILVGEISDKELADYYHASDAFIWASDENQSWGLAAMEAMTAGKPVLVSTANGLAEVLENNKTALLFPPRSPSKIAEAVMRLVKDRPMTDSIAWEGKKLMCEGYTWRKNAEEMLALFEESVSHSHFKSSIDKQLC